ncbi:MAG: caspase family protein [Saprospiraceae bacterium]
MSDTNQASQDRGIGEKHLIEATAEHQRKHNHLLAIAVDAYEDEAIDNLSNCVSDVEDLLEVLTTDYFFERGNIRFLRSRDVALDKSSQKDIQSMEKDFAFIGEATHELIIAQLKDLAKTMRPNDNLIICYSGHGIYDQDFNEGYWIPADGKLKNNASYIENGTIRTALNAINTHHTVLISDSCYSGTLFSAGKQRSLDIPRVYKHPSRWGLTAGRRNETVSDGNLGGNSPFARELIRILKRKQEVWIGDLCKEIVTEIEHRKEAQTPMGEPFADMKAHDGGQFVFLPRLATEKDYWKIAWRENTRKSYYAFLARYPSGTYEKAAMDALNVFVAAEKPQCSEAALATHDFLYEVLPDQAKYYAINFLKGISQSTLSEVGLEMYGDLFKHFPALAERQLKSFILLGKDFAKQQAAEAAYVLLPPNDSDAKKAFFQSFFHQQERRNPYLGLAPYTTKDSESFFGRRAVVQQLWDQLASSRFLLLSGPADSGKSSVIAAGLLPLLQEREGYDVFSMVPTADAYWEMEDLLSKEFDPNKKQVLFIDQYETFFTQGSDHYRRKDIESLLIALDTEGKFPQLKVILALRSNVEGLFQAGAFGRPFWNDEQAHFAVYRLPAMQENELREVILGPAWSGGYEIEPEVVDALLKEVKHSSNVLPFLSASLQNLFELEAAEAPILTNSWFRKKGMINRALNALADKVYGRLEPEKQRIMQQIFLRMVYFSGEDYSSRLVTLDELFHPNAAVDQLVGELLDHLVKEKLLEETASEIVDKESGRSVTVVKPTNKLLINYWPRYREWIEALGQENLLLQRDLWEATLKNRDYWKQNHWTRGDSGPLPEDDEALLRAAPYWDNHPKLNAILDHILGTSTPLLLAATDNPLRQAMTELQQQLSGKELQLFQSLMEKWRQNGTPAYLDDFIITGASGKLLGIFLKHGTHWLNSNEAAFIQRSWEKRSADIAQVFQQRDEAIQAKKAAEAARERTIDEVIEASWKAGNLYGEEIESADTYIQGVRSLYAKLKLFMSLKKAQSLSPIPIFIKGPHQEDFDMNADAFGYYNPAFLAWAKQHVIPARGNTLLRKATQVFYNKFLRDLARVYYLAYRHLEQHPDLRDGVKAEYLSAVEGGLIQGGGLFNEHSGGLILQESLRAYPDQYQTEMDAKLGEMAFYYWVVASGFWIRRHIDTTAAAFMDILVDLLGTYDSEWLADPPVLP